MNIPRNHISERALDLAMMLPHKYYMDRRKND